RKKGKQKRPDKKLYIPPAAKHECEKQVEISSETEADDLLKLSNLTLNSVKNIDSRLTKSQEEKNLSTEQPLTEHQRANNEDDISWDNLYDENGDCVKPELLNEFRETLNLKENDNVTINKTTIDYYQFQPYTPVIEESEFPHVLEIYDFSADLKTQDLFTSLSVFNSRDFDIKWVDDTHALAVFASESAALEALKMPYHNMKLRPLTQAIRESKIKAKKCAEFLTPYKQRPETSAALARRLVSGALGIKMNLTTEQRAAEKKKLLEAKERRKQAIKQTQDIWEGNVH
ncbi:coiled-coil domain-containing protein R3HCC1L-like protein, partial [Dinothrombium tinctorium]